MNSKQKFWIILFFALAILVTFLFVIFYETEKPEEISNEKVCYGIELKYSESKSSPLGNFSKFAVASDDKTCSTIGKEILEKGGSAVDAAITVGLCNSLFNAHSMGIGGGNFMVIYIKDRNKSYSIDAREAAPLNSNENIFIENKNKSLVGGLSTGIPGEIYGYWKAHEIGGKLSWEELFQPIIKLSEEGHKVSATVRYGIERERKRVKQDKGLSEVYVNPSTGKAYNENDVIKRQNYANTLRYISKFGYRAFYEGPLTRLIVEEINQNGGNVSLEDFRRYEPRVYENRFMVRLDDEYRAYITPPPSSGILVAVLMKLMKEFKLESEKNMTFERRVLFYHHLFESLKHGYAVREMLDDEKFVNLSPLYNKILSDKYISDIVGKIDYNKTFSESYYGSVLSQDEVGTSHITVIDSKGNAVSLTSSINNWFGAKYAGTKTGIIYNNVMNDFSIPGFSNSYGLKASKSNRIAPMKRPVSSISPIIIVDRQNRVRLALGASGGSRIISAVLQTAIRSLWMNEDIKSAVDERRIHHQLNPDVAWLEEDFPENVEEALKLIGHKTKCYGFGLSAIQGIQTDDNGRILAYSDPRKGELPYHYGYTSLS